MSDIEGFILTGGASSRMGRDKAHLLLEGRTFVERIAEAISAIAARVRLVSSRSEDAQAGLPVVPDLYAHRGALSGLHAALAACNTEWAAVVSCDLPFVTGELCLLLARLRTADSDAVAPIQEDGRPQPLCSLYRPVPCLEVAERLINADELRPRVLLREVRTRWVAPEEWQALRRSELFYLNVNRPEDYARAQTMIADWDQRIAD
ncbi:MAG: molybdenum cofactor guanylyltransferase [Pyrinomonadaceae bacterium]